MPQVFIATPAAERASPDYLLSTLPGARAAMPTDEFRAQLRNTLLTYPDITLATVAQALGISRQAVHVMVGKLDRPNCAHPDRPAPKRDKAAHALPILTERVRRGEAASTVAKELGISLAQASRLGFRTKAVLPPHGTHARAAGDDQFAPCPCWRCRRALGISKPRGRRPDPVKLAKIYDWLAWRDPETGAPLTQVRIGELAGVDQGAVSRIARGE